MALINKEQLTNSYDLVAVGSGFGNLFFLHGYLQRFPQAKILVIERGGYFSRNWQLNHQQNSEQDFSKTFTNLTPGKPWSFNIGFGGGTNCWWSLSPRFMPDSMKMQTNYGIGMDWPISYDDIADYYTQAERFMDISGPADLSVVYPHLEGYPLPAHNLSSVDKIMKASQPDLHFSVPQARASVSTSKRAQCCQTNKCNLCPINAKFSWYNGFEHLVDSPQIDILPLAEVRTLELANDRVTGVNFVVEGEERRVKGDMVSLGANAIHSPAILLRSGDTSPAVGHYLHEKHGAIYEVKLDGVDNFDGSALVTGMNLSLATGDFKRSAAATHLYFCNHWHYHGMREIPGRWRQTLALDAYFETIPLYENHVSLDESGNVLVSHGEPAPYTVAGIEKLEQSLPEILSPLPVESIQRTGTHETLHHIQGTLRMGTDPELSVTDSRGIHHRYRNLQIVGSSLWSSCGLVNPSLTIAALSLRSAELL